jgi:hypothetical protein
VQHQLRAELDETEQQSTRDAAPKRLRGPMWAKAKMRRACDGSSRRSTMVCHTAESDEVTLVMDPSLRSSAPALDGQSRAIRPGARITMVNASLRSDGVADLTAHHRISRHLGREPIQAELGPLSADPRRRVARVLRNLQELLQPRKPRSGDQGRGANAAVVDRATSLSLAV